MTLVQWDLEEPEDHQVWMVHQVKLDDPEMMVFVVNLVQSVKRVTKDSKVFQVSQE